VRRLGELLNWKMILFAVLIVVASIAGLAWQGDGTPPSDGLKRQQTIQVFVSDPNARVRLVAAYAHEGGDHYAEGLYLSIVPSTPGEDVSWVVVSLHHRLDCTVPSLGQSSKTSAIFGVNQRTPPEPAWDCQGDTTGHSLGSLAVVRTESLLHRFLQVSLPFQRAAAETSNGLIAVTPVSGIVQRIAGTGFAQLPAIDLEGLPQSGVGLLYGLQKHGGLFSDVLVEEPEPLTPANFGSNNVKDYARPRIALALANTAFFPPSNMTTESVLDTYDTPLETYHQDQVEPSDGGFQNGDFDWTGNGYIEPTFALSDPAANQARTNDDILAGVSLAVAATSFVALIQEFPTRRRRRPLTDPEPDFGSGGPDPGDGEGDPAGVPAFSTG
jgi:hypothetical protein